MRWAEKTRPPGLPVRQSGKRDRIRRIHQTVSLMRTTRWFATKTFENSSCQTRTPAHFERMCGRARWPSSLWGAARWWRVGWPARGICPTYSEAPGLRCRGALRWISWATFSSDYGCRHPGRPLSGCCLQANPCPRPRIWLNLRILCRTTRVEIVPGRSRGRHRSKFSSSRLGTWPAEFSTRAGTLGIAQPFRPVSAPRR